MPKKTKRCQKCGRTFPQRQLVEGKVRNLDARKYCLVCSPFRKNNRRDLRYYTPTHKWCSKCHRMRKHKFFYRRGRGSLNCWCKDCYRDIQRENARRLKLACVRYKGGKCCACSYNKCVDALEFHHRDPKKKELKIATQKTVKLTEKLKRELDKCDLLCSNCHREKHAEARIV